MDRNALYRIGKLAAIIKLAKRTSRKMREEWSGELASIALLLNERDRKRESAGDKDE